MAVAPDTHPFDPTTYTPAVTCEIGFCSTVDLANSEIVRFDGRHALATTSSAALHAGSKVIVVLDMDSLSTLLSSESLDQGPSVDRGIAALVPHLYVRTDGGAFTEITGLPSLDHARGDAISFLGYRDAEAFPARSITVPMGSDRLEMYMRFERFTYHQTHEPVHDTSPPRRVDARTTDGFVSNFGKNFSLPVR